MTAPALELDIVGRAVDRLTDRIGRADIPVVEAALQLGDSTPHKLPAVVVFLAGDDATDSLAPEQGEVLDPPGTAPQLVIDGEPA